MLKDTTYKEKFTLLHDWMPTIIEVVKRDLKNEHLREDPQFIKKHFNNKNPNKLTNEELIAGYLKAIAEEEKAEDIAEFISSRWILKNTEIYQFYEEELTRLSPNFSELKELDPALALDLMEESINRFGAINTYLFAVLNSVVFSNQLYEQLKHRAKEHLMRTQKEVQEEAEHASISSIHQSYQQQISRLTDKYEKKLLGMQKKYTQDTGALKKQLSTLQCKLHDK